MPSLTLILAKPQIAIPAASIAKHTVAFVVNVGHKPTAAAIGADDEYLVSAADRAGGVLGHSRWKS